MKRFPCFLASLTLIAILLCCEASGEPQVRHFPALLLAQSTSTASLCASALQEIEQGRVEKAERLLKQRLELEIEAADRAVAEGAVLPGSPELRLGAERVAAYAERVELPAETQARARRVAAAYPE